MTRSPRDAHQPLCAALIQKLDTADAKLKDSSSVPWASATFAGARHIIDLNVTGSCADLVTSQFLSSIEEEEFNIPGHLVADITAHVSGNTVRVEALTVEAA